MAFLKSKLVIPLIVDASLIPVKIAFAAEIPNELSIEISSADSVVRFLYFASSSQKKFTRSPKMSVGEIPRRLLIANLKEALADAELSLSSSHHVGHAASMTCLLKPASLSALRSDLLSLFRH